MRELKFRVFYGNQMYGNKEALRLLYNDSCGIQTGHKIIMQYTGLNDKNGVEIYLSDIVRHPNATEPEHLGFVVIWHNSGFKLKMIGKANGEHLIIDMPEHEYLSQMEVIGNVHQNKELL